MSRNFGVVGLGNADTASRSGSSAAGQFLADRLSWLSEWPGVTRTLSLFVPGAGQLVRGETTLGLFLLTSTLFLLSLAWALLDTLDRLAGTLELLGISVVLAFWILGGIYVFTGLFHLTAVVTSIEPAGRAGPIVYHPALTGAASALVPGWGQLLNGERVRTMLFIAGIWIAGGVWLVLSPAATELFNVYLPAVSSWEQAARRPGLLWAARYTFPAVVWALAVYDAAASSANRR